MPRSKEEREDLRSRLAMSPSPTDFGDNLFARKGVASVPTRERCPRGCGGVLQSTCGGKVCGNCGWREGFPGPPEAEEMVDCTNCGARMPRNGECLSCGAVVPITTPWED